MKYCLMLAIILALVVLNMYCELLLYSKVNFISYSLPPPPPTTNTSVRDVFYIGNIKYNTIAHCRKEHNEPSYWLKSRGIFRP